MNKQAFRGIRNIIFDLGGVILNIEHNLSIEAFKKLGFSNWELAYSEMKASCLFEKLERGGVSPDHFREQINSYLSTKVSDQSIDAAWCAMLLDMPEENIRAIENIKDRYQLYLLSNTNEIHIARFKEYFNKPQPSDLFSGLFVKEYYSNDIGMRKPDREIYDFVLQDSKLKPQETLFIDDTQDNIIGATQLGINTYWFKSGNKLPDFLQQF